MTVGGGRVALVTGASSGIGRATARAFASEGYSLVLADVREDGGREAALECEMAGASCRFISCDVSDEASVKKLIAEIIESFGRLDVAFNNAGIEGEIGPVGECATANSPPVFHPERRVFARETTGDWELGARTSWLDHALTLNLTFYRMNIKGFQDRAFDGTSFTVRNAGNLRHQGFEFDGVARPLRNFSLFANIAYLDSGFTKYPNAANLPGFASIPGSPPTQDLTGKPATFAPKWSGRVGFDWNGTIGAGGLSWDLTSNLSFVSKQYGGLVNDANPQTLIKGYALLGGRATLNGPGDRWSFALFGDNLTNKQYELGNLYQFLEGSLGLRNGVFAGSTAVRRLHADPRTYGASLTVRF